MPDPTDKNDAATDPSQDLHPREVFVRPDLEDLPKLVQIRLTTPPTDRDAGTLERVRREAEHSEAAHPSSLPPRTVFDSPPTDYRNCVTDRSEDELHENVQKIEAGFFKPRDTRTRKQQLLDLRYLKLLMPAEEKELNLILTKGKSPLRDPTPEEEVRNTWLREQFYEEVENRVRLDHIEVVENSDCDSALNQFNLRLSTGLPIQRLAAFLKDERFGEELSRREATFYKDYAKGEELSVELMIKRHGTWTDEEIIKLENRIIRQAAAAGIFVLNPNVRGRGDTSKQEDFIENDVRGSGGASIGGGITVKKREDGSVRALTDFETRPPTTRIDPDKPVPGASGSVWDDYGEDSKA